MPTDYQIRTAAKFTTQHVCPNNPTGTARPWRAWLRTDYFSGCFDFATRDEAVAYLAYQSARLRIDTRARHSTAYERITFQATFIQELCEGGEVANLADLELVPVYTVALPPAPVADPAPMLELAAGTLAYYDSHTSGLIPCKVVTIDRYSDSNTRVLLTVTGTRGSYYTRGKQIDATLSWVMPRAAVRRVRGSYGMRIRVAPFRVIVTRGA